MNLAFVFSMENPNNYKVMLDDMKFTVSFEEFEVNTITYFDDNYIPAKSTDHLRINGVFDSLTVQEIPMFGKARCRKKKNCPKPDLVKNWW